MKSWPKFLRIWQVESLNFRNPEARINALRNSVTSDLDRQAIDNAQSESKIFEYLYFRYGTRLIMSTKMLAELETCKTPSSDTLEAFLINAVVISEFVAREKQTTLITPQKLGKIVNNCFEQTLCLEWAKKLLKLKEECKNNFVSSDVCQNFEEGWQTRYGDRILSEFCLWCKELVALHRTVKLPGKTPVPQGGARASNQVKTASQAYKCILCSGTHADKRGRIRKFLAACNTFLDMSVPQRWNIVRRYKMCVICITSADHGAQGQSCPLKSRLSCKCG